MTGFAALIAKTVATAAFIVALAEIAKRSPAVAGLLLAMPLATALTLVLMHIDGVGSPQVVKVAWSVLLLVPPSLVFLIAMIVGLRAGLEFWITLAASVVATGLAFAAYSWALSRFGIAIA